MKKIRKFHVAIFVMFLMLYSCVYKNSGVSLQTKLGVSPFTQGITLKNFYFSGFGMDHHYLWEIKFNSKERIDHFLKEAQAVKAKNRASTMCLSLSEAPDWWPLADINAAQWNYHDTDYDLYARKTKYGYVCIFLDEKQRLAYVQWFDP